MGRGEARDSQRQKALANVVGAARLLHGLRGLSTEAEQLLTDAMASAGSEGLTKAVIAEAAGLTPGRVSQIIAGNPTALTASEIHQRLYKLTEWPGDALEPHEASFPGRMTYPPYQRRRTRPELPLGMTSHSLADLESQDASVPDAGQRATSLFVIELAAQQLGATTARELERGKRFTHPGDPLGTVLCRAWQADHHDARLVLASYLRGLRSECERRELTPPTFDEVMKALPLAINEARFPDVDVPAMLALLGRDDVDASGS